MRAVDFSTFHPEAYKPYFMHVSSAPDGKGVGCVLVHIESGRAVCQGADSDLADSYAGDVLRDKTGSPMADVVVQYFRRDPLRPDRARDVAGQTETDELGRHEIWLEPGEYEYHFLTKSGAPLPLGKGDDGKAQTRRRVSVVAGRLVQWTPEAGSTPETENPETAPVAREIGLIEEDLICDWNDSDGAPFFWPDVESTLAEICERIQNANGELRFLTFDKTFVRPDLLNGLQARGLPAYESTLTDAQIAIAYRNFAGLVDANCLMGFEHERANHHLRTGARLAKTSGSTQRVAAAPGEYKYLADARVQAAHYAAQASALEQPQGDGMFSQIRPDNGIVPLTGDEAIGQFMNGFLPAPRVGVAPMPRTVLLGAGDKQG